MKKWISIDEAVDYIGVGKTQLYQLAKEGKIPATKVGKQWKFDSDQLDLWLSKKKDVTNFFIKSSYSIEGNFLNLYNVSYHKYVILNNNDDN